MGNPKKRAREDGPCQAQLVLSFPKGFEAQNERQSNKNRNDSRPRESILFSALRGLKDGVHLCPRESPERSLAPILAFDGKCCGASLAKFHCVFHPRAFAQPGD